MKHEWIEICLLEEIPQLGARVIKTGIGDIAVFRTAGDEVFALMDRCPHKGGPLSQGIVYDKRVACPLHNWVISLDTGEATGADVGCTNHYPARIENNTVYVSLKKTDTKPVSLSKVAEA